MQNRTRIPIRVPLLLLLASHEYEKLETDLLPSFTYEIQGVTKKTDEKSLYFSQGVLLFIIHSVHVVKA